LDHLATIHQVNIADKLHGDGLPIEGFQRQMPITDVCVILQDLESVLRRGDVFEYTEVPDMFPA
jgi:hypothetical protein